MDAETKPPRPSVPSEPVGGLAARAAALTLAQAAVARRGGLEDGLNGAAFLALSPRDRAFARALAGAVLRRLGALDAILDSRLQKPPPEPARWLLRLGAAQLLYMDVPDHAAVSITVDQAATSNATRPFKGLINAVLRGLTLERGQAPPEAYAPAWLLARWTAAYGEGLARTMLAEIEHEPPADLSLRGPASQALCDALQAERLPTGGLRTSLKGDVADWPGFQHGDWWVQDAAAALPAQLLAAKAGERVLDLCAAPGGKTLQLAAAGALVTALDRSAPRLKRLRENLARVRLQAEIVVADAVAWPDTRRFKAILLDAPCSATGTFRRHPDVLWAARPSDIAKLCALQSRLLDTAADRLTPGGRLVYCVCSLEPEEGEDQVSAFLQRRPDMRSAPIEPAEAGAPVRALTPQRALRLLPGAAEPGLAGDGFFIARFVKAEA